ncbi:MAG: Lrp/AsnC family transcriptional regulator [Actinobacteria bacterium]|nr:MAG: Lrp/AsnC family transcriptional regulator [Actinomycetota bacterium]
MDGVGEDTGKARTRREGAAVALDDSDRLLLNLLQGRFPLAERPFAAIAEAAGTTEAEAIERTRRLLNERIIRQLTPIYDTRALGYRSMLVAAKVVPTLRLFKIRMDLEMQGDTSTLAAAGETPAPAELEAQPLSELDVRMIQATQGDMPVHERPFDAAAERLAMPVARLLAHMADMRERGLLRRVAAILYHRRAGFSANGMGVWKVPEGRIAELGPRMAAVRGISHCYQRPTYEDWPYSVFTMAHGRSREECDAVLDSIARDTGIEERATLYSSTEFKKIRLLYFTDDFRRWEEQHA